MSDNLRPLKICLLSYRSKPHCGGQGIYVKYLSSALAALGHSVDVVSGEPYPDLEKNVRLVKLPGLGLFEKETQPGPLNFQDLRSFTNSFEWWSVATGGFPEPYTFGRRVKKYLAEHGRRYDLVHDNQSLSYALLDLQKQGTPLAITIHHPIAKDREIDLSQAPNLLRRLFIRRWYYFHNMQKKVVGKLKRVLTVSEASRLDIARYFQIDPSIIKVVHNGVDAECFKPVSGVRRRPGRIMVTASADMPLKGLDVLLKAFARLKPRHPNLELIALGSLNPEGATKKLIDRLGIKKDIIFVNNLTPEEIAAYYSEASLAVVPSLYEGFGLPAGEAMACGTPVISTTGGALPEVVGDAGILIPPGDVAALTQAIADMLDNPEKRAELREAGRRRILEKFSWKKTAEQIIRYYREILNEETRVF